MIRSGANRAIEFTINYFLKLLYLVLGVLVFKEKLFNFFLLLNIIFTGFITFISFSAIIGKVIALNPTFGLVVSISGGAGKIIAI